MGRIPRFGIVPQDSAPQLRFEFRSAPLLCDEIEALGDWAPPSTLRSREGRGCPRPPTAPTAPVTPCQSPRPVCRNYSDSSADPFAALQSITPDRTSRHTGFDPPAVIFGTQKPKPPPPARPRPPPPPGSPRRCGHRLDTPRSHVGSHNAPSVLVTPAARSLRAPSINREPVPGVRGFDAQSVRRISTSRQSWKGQPWVGFDREDSNFYGTAIVSMLNAFDRHVEKHAEWLPESRQPPPAPALLFALFELRLVATQPLAVALRRVHPQVVKAAFLMLADVRGLITTRQLYDVLMLLGLGADDHSRAVTRDFIAPYDPTTRTHVGYPEFCETMAALLAWAPDASGALLRHLSKRLGRPRGSPSDAARHDTGPALVTKGELMAMTQAYVDALRDERSQCEDDTGAPAAADHVAQRLCHHITALPFDSEGRMPLQVFREATRREPELALALEGTRRGFLETITYDEDLPLLFRKQIQHIMYSICGEEPPEEQAHSRDLEPPDRLRWPKRGAPRSGGVGSRRGHRPHSVHCRTEGAPADQLASPAAAVMSPTASVASPRNAGPSPPQVTQLSAAVERLRHHSGLIGPFATAATAIKVHWDSMLLPGGPAHRSRRRKEELSRSASILSDRETATDRTSRPSVRQLDNLLAVVPSA